MLHHILRTARSGGRHVRSALVPVSALRPISSAMPLAAAARGSHHRDSRRRWGSAAASLSLSATAAALVLGDGDARSDEAGGAGSSSDAARWQQVVDASIPAVVVIEVNATRSFDCSGPGATQATGFVVDAALGLVLTNRHVVQSGPVLAEALFQNQEKVPLRAVYRDPVHDFGLFQFDPAALRHLKAPLPQLELRPDLARVGLEIRVMGNNAGEKLSILSGTLARLDRQAPVYGRSSFNDHNTFYYQAASNTSGGSSGSPVIAADGSVVAINAAGMVGTASSYYLPLDRVKRAVDLVRRGQPVPRGTLQATFDHQPFNVLSRVGLPQDVEDLVRASGGDGAKEDKAGMLVVTSLVPGGPGDRAGLQPGDVLLTMERKATGGSTSACRPMTSFVELEALLDDAVGDELSVTVLRGSTRRQVSVTCQDLHAITPAAFLEMGECVFHDLSYHVARNHSTPVEGQGVYVCQAGYMLRSAGVSAGSLILSVGSTPTPDLASFQAAVGQLPDGAKVPIRVKHISNRSQSAVTMLTVDRTWFPAQRVDRLEVALPASLTASAPASPAASSSPSSSSSSSSSSASATTRTGPQGGPTSAWASAQKQPPQPDARESVHQAANGARALAGLPLRSPARDGANGSAALDDRLADWEVTEIPDPTPAAAAASAASASGAAGPSLALPLPPLALLPPSPSPTSSPPPPSLPAEPIASTTYPPGNNKAEQALTHSLVKVDFQMPYSIDGTAGAACSGTGLVVDTKRGLVVVDRSTVPAALGDARLWFGSSLTVPGVVKFIHPLHNLAVVQYDPASIGAAPVKAAVLKRPPQAPPSPLAGGALAAFEAEFERSLGLGAGVGVYVKSTPAPSGPPSSAPMAAAATAAAAAGAGVTEGPGDDLAKAAKAKAAAKKAAAAAASAAEHSKKAAEDKAERVTLVGLAGNTRSGISLVSKPMRLKRERYDANESVSHPPKFLDSNLEALQCDGGGAGGQDGVLVDDAGEVVALWGTFPFMVRGAQGGLQHAVASLGLPAELVCDVVDPLVAGEAPRFRTMGCDLEFVSVGQVRGMGTLGDGEVAALEATCPSWPPRLVSVKRRWGGYPAEAHLMDGDLLLTIDGKDVRTFREVEVACSPPPPRPSTPAASAAAFAASARAAAAAGAGVDGLGGGCVKVWANPVAEARAAKEEAEKATAAALAAAKAEAIASAAAAAAAPPSSPSSPLHAATSVTVELLRFGKRVTVSVPTRELGSDETRTVLLWGGAVLQAPPDAVARQRGQATGGVYVASHSRGSPANKYGLVPTSRIVEVDGTPTPTLEAFQAAVKHKGHQESVRIKQVDLRGVASVSALKLDLTYWPTYEITRTGDASEGGTHTPGPQWRRRLVSPAPKAGPSSKMAASVVG